MMNCNYDIDHIRRLLDRYYRAETSPEDEETLGRFFSEVNGADMPEDLAADQKVFTAMMDLHPMPDECVVPDNLLDKLNSIVEQTKPMPAVKPQKKFHNILRYSGIAAAACIALAIIMVFMRPTENESPIDMEYTAEVVSEMPKEVPEVPVLAESSKPEMVEPKVDHHAKKAESTAITQNEAEEDGFIEITDPEEAQEILLKIGKLLVQNAEETNKAISDIGNSIDSYKEISKSILQ